MSSSSKLTVAVIGGGHLGKIHTRLMKTNQAVDLVAVAEPSPLAQQAIIDEFDVEVVSDYKKLVGQVDAVVIATPTRTHFEIADFWLDNQVHCLIEKPLTDSVTDARALTEKALQNNCIVSVGHCERFNPAIRTALKLVGQPKFVQAARMSGFTFRSTDIGVVHDLMIHDIDLVNSIFDGDAEFVHGTGTSVMSSHEDISQALVKFSGGGVANLTASRCSFSAERSFQIFGTQGYANVDLSNNKVSFVKVPSWIKERRYDLMSLAPEQQAFVRDQLFTKIMPKSEVEVPRTNAILDEHNDWLSAINERTPLTVTAQHGTEAVAIAQQVIDSIGQNSWNQSPAADPIKILEATTSELPAVEELFDAIAKAA